jgi:hypothetical protein
MTLPIHDQGFTQEEIDFGLSKLVEHLNEQQAIHYKTKFPTLPPEHIVVSDRGRIYWKLIREQVNGGGSKSVYGFVRKADGAILKAATWKAPALNHARGFVTDSDYGACNTGVYGINYLI